MFGIKAMMKSYPIRFLIINLIAGTLFFGLTLKYCESPVNRVLYDRNLDLFKLDNSFWLVVVTMTTGIPYLTIVGYGDVFPRTIFGRITIFFCAIFGVVVVSVMVVAI